MTVTRKKKWHFSLPANPRILNLPVRYARSRKPTPRGAAGKRSSCDSRRDMAENITRLEALFDRERVFSKCDDVKGDRGGAIPVLRFGNHGGEGTGAASFPEDERWRFQAEVLRAECNLLRMEKEIAVRKLDRSRAYVERTLRSAIEALISGKKKICEGKKNAASVLEDGIENLVGKLKELGRSSRARESAAGSHKKCQNFDQQMTVLQRRLDKLDSLSETRTEKIKKTASGESLSKVDHLAAANRGGSQVEVLRRRMEGLSKDVMLDRMERESISILPVADSSASSSSSVSKQAECLGDYVPFIRQANHEVSSRKEGSGGRACSGHCKAVVWRVVEQVRAETEQWSQMQEMLGQVRDEMEELQAARDFWEDRARSWDSQNQSLGSAVQEWRQRAVSWEAKATELQLKVSMLRDEVHRLNKALGTTESMGARHLQPQVLSSQEEAEKRVLICSLKENDHLGSADACVDRRKKLHSCIGSRIRRSPLRDIGNSIRQNHGKAVFSLGYHMSGSSD
ncbi:hypothetical protein SAY87_016202 [Trapa incisa]|uniref:Uncharacterized protein n=1 Tax=Trapa incisa TaxID=236973 RepID=A0AAN7LGL1_9MYRT|nr:hypothetical protein SAY87_016202 [Trapa incisa]